MADVVKFPEPEPARYVVDLAHHSDDRLEVRVRDVPTDRLTRSRLARLLGRAAAAFGGMPPPEAERLSQLAAKRISALADAPAGSPEAQERAEWQAAEDAYERLRMRG